MDKGRVKNFIIILLVVVNLFFAAIVLMDKLEAESVRRSAHENLAAVLESSGITLRDTSLLDLEAYAPIHLRRDMDAELSMMRAVLGNDVYRVDKGGNNYFYSGSQGQAQLSGTGEFEILPASGYGEIKSGDLIGTAMDYIKKLGLSSDRATAESGIDGEANIVTLTCTWDKAPVFNCRIKFTFSQSEILLIEGRRTLDMPVTDKDYGTIDAFTALMRFLDALSESDQTCNEIFGLESGYMLNISVSGDGSLIPYWKILTDTGEYTIDGITGRVD